MPFTAHDPAHGYVVELVITGSQPALLRTIAGLFDVRPAAHSGRWHLDVPAADFPAACEVITRRLGSSPSWYVIDPGASGPPVSSVPFREPGNEIQASA